MGSKLSTLSFAALLCVIGALASADAVRAQFGGGFSPSMNLPDDDFTWRWGQQRGNRIDDFSIRALDTGFSCMLTGELRAGSRMSRMDLRRLESELRSSMSFIAAATNAMNGLVQQRELDWAMLDCEKQESDDDE